MQSRSRLVVRMPQDCPVSGVEQKKDLTLANCMVPEDSPSRSTPVRDNSENRNGEKDDTDCASGGGDDKNQGQEDNNIERIPLPRFKPRLMPNISTNIADTFIRSQDSTSMNKGLPSIPNLAGNESDLHESIQFPVSGGLSSSPLAQFSSSSSSCFECWSPTATTVSTQSATTPLSNLSANSPCSELSYSQNDQTTTPHHPDEKTHDDDSQYFFTPVSQNATDDRVFHHRVSSMNASVPHSAGYAPSPYLMYHTPGNMQTMSPHQCSVSHEHHNNGSLLPPGSFPMTSPPQFHDTYHPNYFQNRQMPHPHTSFMNSPNAFHMPHAFTAMSPSMASWPEVNPEQHRFSMQHQLLPRFGAQLDLSEKELSHKNHLTNQEKIMPISSLGIGGGHSISLSPPSHGMPISCSPLPIPLSPAAYSPASSSTEGASSFVNKSVRKTPPRNSACASPVTPLPQNLRGDPLRLAKIKTELCLHYARGLECPFGDKCNYAHGEDELKYTKLMDLERAGLADSITYRTHPCPSWVSTGACPFGQRCTGIHDPRVASPSLSWLPHAETTINLLPTTVNIDRFYHKRFMSLRQTNPLIGPEIWNQGGSENTCTNSGERDLEREWEKTYDLVCNIIKGKINGKGGQSSLKRSVTTKKTITELQRFEMALIMRNAGMDKSPNHLDYIYQPSHMMYNELCMIIQTRYFFLLRPDEHVINEGTTNDEPISVREITTEEYHVRKMPWGGVAMKRRYSYTPRDVVIVHEIAFGPICEPGVRPTSIWFDIPPEDIKICSLQEVKRYKRAKMRLQKQVPGVRYYSNSHSSSNESRKSCREAGTAHSFKSPHHQPFFHSQPINEAAYSLITSMLKHRVEVLRSSYRIGENFSKACRCLAEQKLVYKKEFEKQKQNLMTWTWPVNFGREKTDDNTDVPPVNVKYRFLVNAESKNGNKMVGSKDAEKEKKCTKDDKIFLHSKVATGFIWKSFVNAMEAVTPLETEDDGSMPSHDSYYSTLRRLEIFRSLSMGNPQDSDRVAPNIQKDKVSKSNSKDKKCASSVDIWESLFQNDRERTMKEWKIIQEHYLDDDQDHVDIKRSTNDNKASQSGDIFRDKNIPLSVNGDKTKVFVGKLVSSMWTRMPALAFTSSSSSEGN